MSRIQKFNYDVGYEFSQYKIIDRVRRQRPNRKFRYLYVLECQKCGAKIEREECYIGKDIKCRECMKNMEYSRFDVGDVVNGQRILKKIPSYNKASGYHKRSYECQCIKDGYIGIHDENNLLQGKGCPVCAGIVIKRGVNDINTVAPWLGDMLENKDDGYRLGIGSKEKVRFKCPFCGELTDKTNIYNVYYSKHVSCKKCGDGMSIPEKITYWALKYINVDFKYQEKFDWSNGKIYDFYIPNNDMIIETHGSQHYVNKKNTTWDSLDAIRANDLYKKDIALNNGIKRYIVIDCSDTDPFNLIRTVQSSLSDYFSFDGIDVNTIIYNSLKSFCIMAGDIWNCGNHNVDNIAEKLKINSATVRRYLRTLTKLQYLNIDYPIKHKGE